MLTVAELMTPTPMFVGPATTLSDAMAIMAAGWSQLPVVDNEQRLVGLLTEGDVAQAVNSRWVAAAPTLDQQRLRVAHVMNDDIVVVTPDTPLDTAAALLQVYRFSALPVVFEGFLVGLLKAGDVLRFFGQ